MMSDTNTKLYDDLMGLREAASALLDLMQNEEWWEGTRATLELYRSRSAYALVNCQEFAERLNMLYLALHPDTDDDAVQDAIYAGHAPHDAR